MSKKNQTNEYGNNPNSKRLKAPFGGYDGKRQPCRKTHDVRIRDARAKKYMQIDAPQLYASVYA